MNRMYQPTPDGYCGDEDNGQTSAWYVFSAMGFYPVTPAVNQYVLGAPLFKKTTIKLENGKTFLIEAPSNSKENLYIQKATLNRKKHEQNWISHEEMLKGGKLKFDMGAEPNMSRGTQDNAVPYSFTNGKTATQNIK